MQTSSNGLALIQSFEGLRLKAYRCPAGVWTIGYGHTAGVTAGQTCTLKQAEDWLKADVAKVERYVNALPYHLNQNQYDALVSFTYNCGAANLKSLTKSNTRTLTQISNAMLLYCRAGGIQLLGLVIRREAERKLFLSPCKDNISPCKDNLYYPKYLGSETNLDKILEAIGATKDYDMTAGKAYQRRIPIAKANGISNYTGNGTQNQKLIKLAKSGELRRP